MKTLFTKSLILGLGSLALLAAASGAQAQNLTPDPTLTLDFSTNTGTTPATKPTIGLASNTLGVGFDTNNAGSKFPVSVQSSNAQTDYGQFIADSSAAGGYTTITAGSPFQLGLYASANNNGSPFDVYATLYNYTNTAAAGTVPITGGNLFGSPLKIVVPGTFTSGFFYSNTITLPSTIVAGSSYVLGITTLSNDTQDYATVSRQVDARSGLNPADYAFDNVNYQTLSGDQGNPTGLTGVPTMTSGLPIAFELRAAAAPEPGQFMTFGVGLLTLGLLAARRRARA